MKQINKKIKRELPFLNIEIDLDDKPLIEEAFKDIPTINDIRDYAYQALTLSKGDCDILKILPYGKKVIVKRKDRGQLIDKLIQHYLESEDYEKCKHLKQML